MSDYEFVPANPLIMRAVFVADDGRKYEWTWRPQMPKGDSSWCLESWQVFGPNGAPLVSMPLTPPEPGR